MSERRYEADIVQGGQVVASVDGPDIETVHREAMHYFAQYMQDGPTEIQWKNMGPAEFEKLKDFLGGK